MTGAGKLVAVGAVVVHAPRLVLAYLEAEGVPVSPSWRVGLLWVAAIATAGVLTGGQAYLAGSVMRLRSHRGVVVSSWVLLLAATAALVAPLLVGSLSQQELSAVLSTPASRWLWALTAVVAVEVVAGASAVAQAATDAAARHEDELEVEVLELGRERAELRRQLGELKAELGEVEAELVELRDGARGQLEQRAQLAASAREQESRGGRAVACRYGCGYVGSSPKAEAGHLRACPARPDRD